MAIVTNTSGNNSSSLMLSLKVAMVSTCVLSVGMAVKLSLPLISDFISSDVPFLWNVVLQWLKPPYLYLVINCIIISIVATSKLQQPNKDYQHDDEDHRVSPDVSVATGKVEGGDIPVRSGEGYDLVYENDHVRDLGDSTVGSEGVVLYGGNGEAEEEEEKEKEKKKKKVNDDDEMLMDGGDEVGAVEAELVKPQRSDSVKLWDLPENGQKEKRKPPVSAKLRQRKSNKSTPEGGRLLGVTKSKREETLESTWKAITEGRSIPLTRHLKKSDTWDTQMRHNSPLPPPKMKKSETFNEGNNAVRLRREPSLSQDELNRRVEAFIKKFNEEMRLQRQRSLDQYKEMISRGVN